MKLLFLPCVYLLMISQALAADTKQVSGFVGQPITLKPGYADSSGISTIEWSIFTNNTFIATFRNGNVRDNRIPQFKGRLKLNKDNGDLEIRDLKKEDSRLYIADITRTTGGKLPRIEIQLSVKQRLEKPTITDLFNTVENGYCVMGLRCSSILQGTNISWKSDASQVNEAFFQKRVGNATELFVFFKSNASRNVTLTCVAANDDSEEFEVVGKTCQGDKPICPPIRCPKPCISDFFFFLTFVIGVIVGGLFAYKFNEKLKKKVDYCKRKFRDKKSDCVQDSGL
ncbi:SLAM family member 9 [Hypomesus transpacificus]|uniref:SLAM family member 9 n=1 Tax=Hypomesus transpacificus TaxID=137520 RepID=UPI001F085FDA|nr:SLAM family member 9 [Hypomesus transpacificus]